MNHTQRDRNFSALLGQFDDAQKWLFSLITDPTGSRYFEVKDRAVRQQEFEEQISRMADFLAFAGNPQSSFNSIHVAGTSGKGSVVNMLAAMLSRAGIRTGFHVSPYVQVCNEKLVLDGQPISPSDFIALVDHFKLLYIDWKASSNQYNALKYGEAWVALTYLWLAQQNVEWAVIETGLGGRYDPTNVLPADLAIITNVDYDHVEVLGEDIREIASHKAGIIKADGMAVTGEQNEVVLEIIQKEAAAKGASLYRLGKDFDYRRTGDELIVDGPKNTYQGLRLGLLGAFQPINAAVAIAALDLLRDSRGLGIDRDAVKDGLAAVRYPGRMEIIQENPTVILDGAHNPHKIDALAETLKSNYPGRKFTVMIGMLVVKDGKGMIGGLHSLVGKWAVTQPDVFGKPSLPAGELYDMIRASSPAPVKEYENVGDALDQVLAAADPDEIILVTGSIYLIGEARERWEPSEKLLYGYEYRD